MSAKIHVDRMAAEAIVEQINLAERKIRMMKQYVNPEAGTVNDMKIVIGLHKGAEDSIDNIRDLLIKFM